MSSSKIIQPAVRFRYKLIFELSLCCSLLILIAAFKFFPNIPKAEQKFTDKQELFKVEDITNTVQKNLPPPPPREPSIIIAVPTDEVLKDVEIRSTELDVGEKVAPPPPPVENVEKKIDEEPSYFVVVEEMPEPIGGITAIQEKIKYPEIAKRAGIEGTVFILAYLNEKGEVVKVEIAKSLGGGCDEEAVEAVRRTKFNPGKQRGKAVRVKVMIPIKFRLQTS